MRAIIFYIILLSSLCSYSQNLVENGSFEDYHLVPKVALSETRKIKNWEKSGNSTDYYHADAGKKGYQNASTPINRIAFQEAMTGFAYAGFLLNNNEFLQTKLTETLVKDSLYFGRFYVSLADSSSYSGSKINMYLQEKRLSSKNSLREHTKLVPAIQNCENCFLEDTLNWMPVSGFYRASKDENYLIIACFNIPWNEGCKARNMKGYVYYFVDEVSLYKVKDSNQLLDHGIKKAMDLDEIIFDMDKSDIKSEHFPYLNKVIMLLEDNPFLNINLWGYTSNVGTEARNNQLAVQRAKSIQDFLLAHNIDENRINRVGKGENDLNKKTISLEFF